MLYLLRGLGNLLWLAFCLGPFQRFIAVIRLLSLVWLVLRLQLLLLLWLLLGSVTLLRGAFCLLLQILFCSLFLLITRVGLFTIGLHI